MAPASKFYGPAALAGMVVGFLCIYGQRENWFGAVSSSNQGHELKGAPGSVRSEIGSTLAWPPRRCDASLTASARGNLPDCPSWAVPFGKEFWRRSEQRARSLGLADTPLRNQVRIKEAVERVTHAFAKGPNGLWHLAAASYDAALEAGGLSFAPGHPSVTASGNRAYLRTSAVRRGGHEWLLPSGPPGGWHVSGNTAQELLDAEAGLVEHYEARRAGVDLTWVLNGPPAGQGDLTIESEIAGVHFIGRSGSGIHFADASGVAQLRIGAARVVDARGQTWPIDMEIAGATLRATIPDSILAKAQFPLALDPLISAEFGMDQPVDSPTPCTRAAPVVAASEGGYLVAWTHGKGDATDPAVYAARVSRDGRLLDPYGILVSAVAGEQTTCAVAATPGGFLVVWSAPHGTSVSDWDILAARVQADGTVLDVPSLPVCTLSGLQNSPAVAANGDNYLVVWRDGRSTGIYGALVSPEGRISPTNGFPVSTAVNDQYLPAVASLGTNFLVAWQDYRKASSSQYYSDIYAARVTGDGKLIDTNGIAVCTKTNSQYHPTVAGNGTNYLVVWDDYDPGGNDIVGARVSPSGLLLDTNALIISHATNAQVNPAVTGLGGDFLVIWQDYRLSPTNDFEAGVYGARVNGEGIVLDVDGVSFSSAPGQANPTVAGYEGEIMAAWQDSRNNPASTLSDIYGVRAIVDTNLTPTTERALSGSANGESTPAAASNGTNYLVVWVDSRNASTTGLDIYGSRLDTEAGLLDLTPFPICTASNLQADPAVAANGANFLVVWSDWRNTPANALHADVFGSLVSAAGQVLQPDGIPICIVTNDQSQPAVSALGTNFLVVWKDARNSTSTATNQDIYGARVDPGGSVLDSTGIRISTATRDQTLPAVAANNQQALVAWSDSRGGATTSDIYGARLALDGTVLDTNGLAICTAPAVQTAPAVAANGEGYLVVWADSRNGLARAPDIYGAMVDANGQAAPSNGFALLVATGVQTAPSLAFNGTNYFVTWQEARAGLPNSYDIVGIPIGADGSTIASFLMEIGANGDNNVAPTVVAGADGRFLSVNQALYSAGRRVVVKLVNPQAMPVLGLAGLGSNGQFQFVLHGAAGERYAVEASDDLKTWVSLKTFTNTGGLPVITDSATTNLPLRFYRAVLLP